MSYRRFISLFVVAAFALGSHLSIAEIVQKNEDSTENGAFEAVSNTDLINQGQSTLDNHVRSPEGKFGDNTNDGAGKLGRADDSEYWSKSAQPNTLTYTLDTTLNTRGYDIKKIQSVTGWIAAEESQANQNFELFISKIGSDAFTSLGSFKHKPYYDTKGGAYAARITLTDDTGTIASDVDAVRFIFKAASFEGTHPGLVIREIDVEGDATGSVTEDE